MDSGMIAETDYDKNTSVGDNGYRIIGRKSWVAYLSAIIVYLILFPIAYMLNLQTNINIVVYIILSLLFIYRIAVIRSYKVSVTNEGVWLKFGVFPWTKSGNGIRWNDADMAFYYPTFLSWITNSYKISVKHKYTNKNDFVVKNIWKGRKVSAEISETQRQLLKNNNSD